MLPPFLTLTIAVAAILLGLLVFWPERGLIPRWQRLRRLSARVLSEDALKHLYKAETAGRHPSLQGVAGALHVSLDQAADLLNDMEAHDLVAWEDDRLHLTSDGRDYALHVIRAHRLWERYLADRTGFRETEWHAQAERFEHMLTPADAEDLARRLGHPTHDPHGDPIPTADGALARHDGQALTTVTVGEAVRIVHVEDEPEAVYAQLVAEGLAPGMELRVLEKTPQFVRFWSEGDEHVLAPLLANNLSVVPLPVAEPPETYTGERLSDLKPGQQGRVLRISRACHGADRRRLLDLGLTTGTVVEAEMASAGGDPVAYRIRGAMIALRREQANLIHMERLEQSRHNAIESNHDVESESTARPLVV